MSSTSRALARQRKPCVCPGRTGSHQSGVRMGRTREPTIQRGYQKFLACPARSRCWRVSKEAVFGGQVVGGARPHLNTVSLFFTGFTPQRPQRPQHPGLSDLSAQSISTGSQDLKPSENPRRAGLSSTAPRRESDHVRNFPFSDVF